MRTVAGLCVLTTLTFCTIPGLCEPSAAAPELFTIESPAGAERMLHYADSALAANPANTLAWSLRVAAYQLQGRHDDAFQALQSALKIDSNSIELAMFAQEVYGLAGKREEGQRIYRRIIAAHPEIVNPEIVQDMMDYSYGSPEEALKSVDEMLEQRPDDAVMWRNKGEVLIELNRYGEALTTLETAVRIDSALPDLDIDFACIHAAMGDHAKALSELARAISDQPMLKEIARDRECFKALSADPEFKRLVE